MKESKQTEILNLLYLIGTFGLVLYLFYPTLSEIAHICWTDDDYSHGLLLPIVLIYLLWDRKDAIFNTLIGSANEKSSLVFPWLILVSGLLLFFIGQASQISFTSWIAFFPVLIACIYLAISKTAALTLGPPIMLLFMAKPLPDSLVVRLFWPLQVLAARVSKEALSLLGVPVFLSGNIIEIPSMRLLVEEACSGMRSVMAMLTLALIVSFFIELKVISKFALVLLALLVALILNIFRVASTGLLAHFYDPQAATGFFHTFSGLIVFIIGLPILYYGGVFLTKLENRGKKLNESQFLEISRVS